MYLSVGFLHPLVRIPSVLSRNLGVAFPIFRKSLNLKIEKKKIKTKKKAVLSKKYNVVRNDYKRSVEDMSVTDFLLGSL